MADHETTRSAGAQGLNLTDLGRMLQDRRGALSIRQASADAGVSFSTCSRVEGGAHPDLATFTQLCSWLRVPPARFFNPVTEREITPLDHAVTFFFSSRRRHTRFDCDWSSDVCSSD